MVLSFRALCALSVSFHVSTVNWSLFSVSPKSTRIIVVHALSLAHTAKVMWCWENKQCIWSRVKASQFHKRETTVKLAAVKQKNCLQTRGLKLIPSETTWDVKAKIQKIITSMQRNIYGFLGYLTPQFTAHQMHVRPWQTGRTQHLRVQHLIAVSLFSIFLMAENNN